MIDIASKLSIQQEFFKNSDIPTDLVGFYDNPNFMAIERVNPEFLNCYASFVNKQVYTPEYLANAKSIISFATEYLFEQLKIENSQGRCVEVSMILSRILEKFGIWNFITKGSLTLSFPEKDKVPKQYFWTVTRNRVDAGHAWLVAPPFAIIDLTLKHQPYTTNINSCLPNYILAETAKKDALNADDILDHELLMLLKPKKLSNTAILKKIVPHVIEFSKVFHPESLQVNNIEFKYTPTAIGAPDMSLETLPKSINKKLALDLFNEIKSNFKKAS